MRQIWWRAVTSSAPTLPLLCRRRHHLLLFRPFSAAPAPAPASASDEDSVFDSREFPLPPPPAAATPEPSWKQVYRDKAERKIFGKEVVQEDKEKDKRANRLAKALLRAALEKPDAEQEANMIVKEEDQRSLSVGIIGAPNAGKSALTNFMVGTKVSAVSRKTNTTIHEVLGVLNKGSTQICFFDTPGLMLKRDGHPHRTDVNARVESAWSSVDLYDVLVVLFDVHRHLAAPDKRVIRLIERMGSKASSKQKRVLCMNKVDLVEVKKDLLKVAQEFGDLPGYDKYFMISGLTGSGVKDLSAFLMEQAVKRPWDAEPTTLTEEIMKNISLEVVRERMLDYIHQEIPYSVDHCLVGWKELRDGSLRIEQHITTHKPSQRKIIVGKKGSKIGKIGSEANEELRSIFKRDVHLILQVKLA